MEGCVFGAPGRSKLRLYEALCGIAAGTDAVGHTDAAVRVARESKPGQLLAQAFHAVEALEMSDAVLRHGRFPFVDPGEKRIGAQAIHLWTQDLLQFVAHDSDDLVVVEGPDVFRIVSREKATEQGPVFRSPVRKFVVHERCG